MKTRVSSLIAVAIAFSALAGTAHAQFETLPTSPCNAEKLRSVRKTTQKLLGCHANGGAKLGTCLAAQDANFNPPVPGKGPFDKADARNQGCLAGTTANQASYQLKLDHFASRTKALLAVSATPTHCDDARLRCVAKYVAGMLGCIAKTARKNGGTVDPACRAKQALRFSDPITPGCYDKATAGCSNGTTAAVAQAAADSFVAGAACNLLPGATPCPPVCDNLFREALEPCDASAEPDVGQCGNVACAGCTCADCPTTLRFTPDASAPETVSDLGWTGSTHRVGIPVSGDVTFGVLCNVRTPPCGTCTLTSALPNAGAGELASRRCTGDPRVPCAADGDCTLAGGTCALFSGTLQPIAAPGGYPLGLSQWIEGPVTGTVQVETGAIDVTLGLARRVYQGLDLDHPCPRCTGDATANDGVASGTCSGGAHDGESCDANGSVPGWPELGTMSLDCPPSAANVVGNFTSRRRSVTDTVTMTRGPLSPTCNGTGVTLVTPIPPGSKCLCDTCNNGNAELCSSNADCPPSGGNPGICGGRRCLGGPNAGGPCAGGFGGESACPGASCGWRGVPTLPSACSYDDCSLPTGTHVGCIDTAPIDGEGECDYPPGNTLCAPDSAHPNAWCDEDDDCGGAAGSCRLQPRLCFLTGPFTPNPTGQGTGTLIAAGAADPPLGYLFSPTLASVYCSSPMEQSSPTNNVIGLPGPSREVVRGQAAFAP